MLYVIAGLTFFLIFFVSPAKIHILFKKKSSDEYIKIQTVYFGIIKFNLVVPRFLLKFKNLTPIVKFNIETFVERNMIYEDEVVTSPLYYSFRAYISFIQKLPSQIKKFHRLFKFFLRSVRLSRLEFSCSFGLEDPANAAIFTGGIYTVSHLLLLFLSRHLDLSETDIKVEVKPVFLLAQPLEIDLYSIISVRVGHIIIASFYTLVLWISARRQIMKKFKGARFHGRSSDRKSY